VSLHAAASPPRNHCFQKHFFLPRLYTSGACTMYTCSPKSFAFCVPRTLFSANRCKYRTKFLSSRAFSVLCALLYKKEGGGGVHRLWLTCRQRKQECLRHGGRSKDRPLHVRRNGVDVRWRLRDFWGCDTAKRVCILGAESHTVLTACAPLTTRSKRKCGF
jgi:hypothetical protein